MSELILPKHLQKKIHIIPMEFINRVPDIIIRQICWGFVNAVSAKDGPMADYFLRQLMMEVDIAGISLNEEIEKKKEAKKKAKNEKSKK